MRDVNKYFGPMRPAFLLLTPACVALGVASASASGAHILISDLVLALLGAIAAHISANMFNEYFDYKSDLDSRTLRTPFSGGSGTLQQYPEVAGYTLAIATATLGLTILIGVYFALTRGAMIIPLGLVGLVLIATYTQWLTRHPLAYLLSTGLAFGPLMVLGTHFALTGAYGLTALLISLIPFFLVNNLLLLNQFPDVDADRSVGRKNIPMILGRQKASIIFGVFLLLVYLLISVSVMLHYLPALAALGLLTVLLAVPTFMGVYRHADEVNSLLPYMSMNVLINITTPLLVAAGIFWG